MAYLPDIIRTAKDIAIIANYLKLEVTIYTNNYQSIVSIEFPQTKIQKIFSYFHNRKINKFKQIIKDRSPLPLLVNYSFK